MKLNGTPRHYMPLSQSQSDDEENILKPMKCKKSSDENSDVPKSFEPQLQFRKGLCEDTKCLPMSPLRTLAFILSLLLCVLFIILFLWLLPCESFSQESLLEKWSIPLSNISATTGISLVRTSTFSSPLLVFGYRNWETEPVKHGVMAIWKTNGEIKWQIDLHFQADSIICNVIDVNNDGSADCLVVGLQGLMTALDAKAGTSLWYLHSHGSKRVADTVSLPTALLDCNGDKTPELAVSYTFSLETNSAYIGLISGGTGEVIGSPVSISQCISPILAHSSINWKNKTAFLFYCTDGKAGTLYFSYSEDICNIVMNGSEPLKVSPLHRDVPLYSVVQFHKISDNKVAVIFNGMKAMLLTAAKHSIKINWITHLKKDVPWKAELHGHFLDGKHSQLVLTSTNDSSSEVIGLSLLNGHQEWSSSFKNSTVTSAFSLPGFFRDVDGIILKMIATDYMVPSKISEYNITKHVLHDHNVELSDYTFQVAEESYVLLHGGEIPQFTKINVQEILHTCTGDVCQPNIFTEKNTAVAAWLNNEEVDMCVISTSLVPNNCSGLIEYRTTIKLLKLEKFCQFSKCMYKLGS